MENKEYSAQVDFNPAYYNHPLRGEVMIHYPGDLVLDLLKELYNRDILNQFEVTLRPQFFGKDLSQCLQLTCRTCITPVTHLKILLSILEGRKIEIIWKEGDFGYKVNKEGVILDKWELDDGMC
jgi:hypothetical protein